MGDIADDMIDGLCCSLCNSYFEQEHGYPVVCPSCWNGLSEADKQKYQKAVHKAI